MWQWETPGQRSCVAAAAQVELIEQPFTVITLADVNLVNLERVGFGLRNFDMAIVPKVRPPVLAQFPLGRLRAQNRRSQRHTCLCFHTLIPAAPHAAVVRQWLAAFAHLCMVTLRCSRQAAPALLRTMLPLKADICHDCSAPISQRTCTRMYRDDIPGQPLPHPRALVGWTAEYACAACRT